MKTDFKKIFLLNNFFNVVESKNNIIYYYLRKPSIILTKNVYSQWLKSIWLKSDKHFPVYLNKTANNINVTKLPFGILNTLNSNLEDKLLIKHDTSEYTPSSKTHLEFKLYVPEQDIMQYFIQWQQYRKYWWSSITTTPGLFKLNDIKYKDKSAEMDIIVQLPWGSNPVETVSIETNNNKNSSSRAVLSCTTTLETALITTLCDGMVNGTKEEYLRLERKIAPYKISFALEYNDTTKKNDLHELAKLLNSILLEKNVSTWLPEFTLPLDEQIRQNLQTGVVYTAIIGESTLTDGIFHLLSSSTTLREEVHVADFADYAALLCRS